MYTGSILLIVGVLIGNIGLNPANFATNGLVASTRLPALVGPGGGAYSLTVDPDSNYGAMVQLSSIVPHDARLLFQSQFYPLVGSDPYAYTYVPAHLQLGGVQRSPYNNTSFPDYVLSTRQGLNPFNCLFNGQDCPGFNGSKTDRFSFAAYVWNTTAYGVLGWVQTTRFGSVYLFERGYTGPVRTFGPVNHSTLEFLAGYDLKPGGAGRLGAAKKHKMAIPAITSSLNETGRMWVVTENRQSVPNGNYYLELDLFSSGKDCQNLQINNSTATLLELSAYVPSNRPLSWPGANISVHDVPCNTWTVVPLYLTLTYPLAKVYFAGERPQFKPLDVALELVWVQLVPAGSTAG